MTGWLRRMGALFGGRGSAPAGALPRPAVEPAAVAKAAAPAAVSAATNGGGNASAADARAMAALKARFLEWLVGGPLAARALNDSEKQLLEHLDATIASTDSRASLLPRAPAVIPQLLNSLRDDSQPAAALVQRVTRDPNLVVEVIRMANSAQARAGAPLTDLTAAIQRVGNDGLRRAILRVMLKPIFSGQADSLTVRCSQRLWQHSEAKAAACMQQAGAQGLDPFDGYLAGLMHNVGWMAALRAIDRSNVRAPVPLSLAFMAAVEARRDTLFALLVAPWQLAEALNALAAELLDGGLAQAPSRLGHALGAADHLASMQMLGAVPSAPHAAAEPAPRTQA